MFKETLIEYSRHSHVSFYLFLFLNDIEMINVGRRIFLKLGTAGIAALIVVQWNKIVSKKLESEKKQKRVFPLNKNKPISFTDSFIIINQGGNTKVLSAYCTHLGCKISETANGRIICPCHGSEYDLNGVVLKGPAYKNLKIIQASVSQDGTQIEIFV